MRNAEELEAMFCIAPERIAKIDADACKGMLHGVAGETVTGPGRPPLFGEEMRHITFKEPASRVASIDKRAEQLGMSRSDYLRQLIENDLVCAGVA